MQTQDVRDLVCGAAVLAPLQGMSYQEAVQNIMDEMFREVAEKEGWRQALRKVWRPFHGVVALVRDGDTVRPYRKGDEYVFCIISPPCASRGYQLGTFPTPKTSFLTNEWRCYISKQLKIPLHRLTQSFYKGLWGNLGTTANIQSRYLHTLSAKHIHPEMRKYISHLYPVMGPHTIGKLNYVQRMYGVVQDIQKLYCHLFGVRISDLIAELDLPTLPRKYQAAKLLVQAEEADLRYGDRSLSAIMKEHIRPEYTPKFYKSFCRVCRIIIRFRYSYKKPFIHDLDKTLEYIVDYLKRYPAKPLLQFLNYINSIDPILIEDPITFRIGDYIQAGDKFYYRNDFIKNFRSTRPAHVLREFIRFCLS
ncbi:MAG: hypothetical protein D6698_04945 [Gammaproteobacteria bacterium]|nr:MAG: hypothetical protein D6698_04945 [Gammaproteobacteria bacterium]